MKRSFSLPSGSYIPLVVAGTGLIAATYGLIRLAFGLFLPDVQRDLGLDVAVAGAVSGGASVVYCIGALLGLLVAERHPRALIAASALSGAAGAIGMAAAPGPAIFAVSAILGSAGAGLASPALVAVLQRNAVTRDRPRLQTVVNAGTGPGLVAAGVLALLLLPDWRAAWLIAALVTVGFAGVVLASDRRGSDVPAARTLLPPASWFAAHRTLLAAALLMGAGSAAVWTYGRTLLVASGADETVSVAAWIALGVGGTAVIGTARRLERRGPRAAWILTVCAVAGASAVLVAAPGSAALALAACAVFGWGYTAATGALIAWTAEIDAPRASAGTALLFITLILGQAIGAGVFGALVPVAGYPATFLAAAGASLAAAALAGTGRAGRGDARVREKDFTARTPVR